MAENLTVNVLDATGKLTGSVELPAEVFNVELNVPLIHQVVWLSVQLHVRERTTRRLAQRSAAVAASRTSKREPAAPVRARHVPRSSPVVASFTGQCRVATYSALLRR